MVEKVLSNAVVPPSVFAKHNYLGVTSLTTECLASSSSIRIILLGGMEPPRSVISSSGAYVRTGEERRGGGIGPSCSTTPNYAK